MLGPQQNAGDARVECRGDALLGPVVCSASHPSAIGHSGAGLWRCDGRQGSKKCDLAAGSLGVLGARMLRSMHVDCMKQRERAGSEKKLRPTPAPLSPKRPEMRIQTRTRFALSFWPEINSQRSPPSAAQQLSSSAAPRTAQHAKSIQEQPSRPPPPPPSLFPSRHSLIPTRLLHSLCLYLRKHQ